jgi:hypothetical protein
MKIATFLKNPQLAQMIEQKLQQIKPQDAKAIYSLFTAKNNHQEMLERYWPNSDMDPSEKLAKTAQRVGLKLPETKNN